jgi:hypothetical protein
MNKRVFVCLTIIISLSSVSGYSQRYTDSANQITSSDLKSHVSFLASPLLKGRMNGEEGLSIATEYIVSQTRLIGLKPANSNSYLQPYSVEKKSTDQSRSYLRIISGNTDTVNVTDKILNIIPTGPSDFSIEGEVVFAGYGIKEDKYKYNDLEDIKTDGKILLVMDRAPLSIDGKTHVFEEPEWYSGMNFQSKLTTLILSKAKAILFVPDPKSGFGSFEEANPELSNYLESKFSLGKNQSEAENPLTALMPNVVFITRSCADEILKGTGHNLAGLQDSIDLKLKPSSFLITGKRIKLSESSKNESITLNNISGYIEGSDPVLKNEIVIYSSHYDHIGKTGEKINYGADDNASGCAALLSIAKAFQSLDKKPLRTIMFLWVSGEEIGLYGSKNYVDHPLFPLENTVVDLNMDMIGRVKSIADSTSETPMTDKNNVFLITDNQSKELLTIADDIDKTTPMNFDYSLSGPNHPLQLFSRSDHYNFVKKDIPILFFSTGIHTDYHTSGDIIEKLDFNKMETITRNMYEIGLTVANRKTRIVVDNPFSKWTKPK